MRRRAAAGGVVALVLALGLAMPRAGRGYADGPPPRNTGGFRETTCALCHRGGAVNAPGATLEVVAPDAYSPGAEHTIEVALQRPGLSRAGFQLSARLAGGERAGRQAGELLATNEAVQLVAAHGISYASHTAAGSRLAAAGEARWRLRWKAPPAGAGPVVFHVAANASNDDDSEFGDAIYTAEKVVPPAAP